MQAPPPKEHPVVRVALPIAGCLLGLLEVFHPTLLSGFERIQTDVGDTRFNNYILEHGYRWITGREPSFWNPPFFFPTPNAAAFSDTLLGAGPLYWVWRAVGFLPDTSFQLWQLTVAALNFAVFYWFLRRHFPVHSLAAVAGAWLFAFCGPRVAQTMHFQLHAQFFSILVLHGLLRVFEPGVPRRVASRWWLIMGAALTLQLYASYYLGWFLVFGVFVSLLWTLPRKEGRVRLQEVLRRDLRSITAASVLTILALAPMLIHYVRAAGVTGLRIWVTVLELLPRPLSWFAGDTSSWFYAWTLKIDRVAAVPYSHEQSLTFGYLTLIVCLAGLWPQRKTPLVGLLIRVSITLVIISTLFLPGRTLWQSVWAVFPGGRALRAVARIVLLLSIPVGVGVALAVDRLQRGGRSAIAFVLAGLCLLEQGHTTPSFSKTEVRQRVAAEVERIPAGCHAFYLSPVLEAKEQPDWLIQLDAMWASVAAGVPTLNGYSGNFPRDWPLQASVILTPQDEPRIAHALSDWEASRHLDPASVCWVKFRE